MVVFPAYTQVRGVYPLGMSATNSGVTPESGFCYVNQFIFYSRDELIGPHGEVLATGQNSVMMDMNNVVWVSKGKIDFLGGPFFSMSATIPIANNSLTSDIEGGISGGVAFRRSACAWERAADERRARGESGAVRMNVKGGWECESESTETVWSNVPLLDRQQAIRLTQ